MFNMYELSKIAKRDLSPYLQDLVTFPTTARHADSQVNTEVILQVY